MFELLSPEPDHGWLIITPSTSPENRRPMHDGITMASGATLDNQLVFDILTKTAEAAGLLKTDVQLIKQIEETILQLPPMQIGQHSQLQEWFYDWDRIDDKHRHVSHLYGLYPSNQISPYQTPESGQEIVLLQKNRCFSLSNSSLKLLLADDSLRHGDWGLSVGYRVVGIDC